MKKIINCKPIDVIELRFNDDKAIILRYGMGDLIHFNDFDDGITGVMKEKSIPEMCAKIIYVGAVESNENFDIKTSRMIVSELSMETINSILQAFADSTGVNMESEYSKKMLAQMLATMK